MSIDGYVFINESDKILTFSNDHDKNVPPIFREWNHTNPVCPLQARWEGDISQTTVSHTHSSLPTPPFAYLFSFLHSQYFLLFRAALHYGGELHRPAKKCRPRHGYLGQAVDVGQDKKIKIK